MRKLVFVTLQAAFLSTEKLGGATPRIYQAGSLGVDPIPSFPEKPFLVVRELPSQKYSQVKETSTAHRHTFQIWGYDERGSYTDIDDYMHLAEISLCSLAGVVSPSGNRCLGVDWLGVSQDFSDDTYDAIVRYGNVQISSNR